MLPHIAKLLGSYLVVSILTFNADVGRSGTSQNLIPVNRFSQNDIGLDIISGNFTNFTRSGAYLVSVNLNIRATAPMSYKCFTMFYSITNPNFQYCSNYGTPPNGSGCNANTNYSPVPMNSQTGITIINGVSSSIYNLNGFTPLDMSLIGGTTLQIYVASNTTDSYDMLAGSTVTISQYA